MQRLIRAGACRAVARHAFTTAGAPRADAPRACCAGANASTCKYEELAREKHELEVKLIVAEAQVAAKFNWNSLAFIGLMAVVIGLPYMSR